MLSRPLVHLISGQAKPGPRKHATQRQALRLNDPAYLVTPLADIAAGSENERVTFRGPRRQSSSVLLLGEWVCNAADPHRASWQRQRHAGKAVEQTASP